MVKMSVFTDRLVMAVFFLESVNAENGLICILWTEVVSQEFILIT